MSSLAYVSLLIAFVSLGAFVAALATGSRSTTIWGAVLVAGLAASVAGFRAAGRAVARSTAGAEPASAVSIFSTPLLQEQIDRYLQNYRGGAGGKKPRRLASPAVGKQKHARPSRVNRLERRPNRERVSA